MYGVYDQRACVSALNWLARRFSIHGNLGGIQYQVRMALGHRHVSPWMTLGLLQALMKTLDVPSTIYMSRMSSWLISLSVKRNV